MDDVPTTIDVINKNKRLTTNLWGIMMYSDVCAVILFTIKKISRKQISFSVRP